MTAGPGQQKPCPVSVNFRLGQKSEGLTSSLSKVKPKMDIRDFALHALQKIEPRLNQHMDE